LALEEERQKEFDRKRAKEDEELARKLQDLLMREERNDRLPSTTETELQRISEERIALQKDRERIHRQRMEAKDRKLALELSLQEKRVNLGRNSSYYSPSDDGESLPINKNKNKNKNNINNNINNITNNDDSNDEEMKEMPPFWQDTPLEQQRFYISRHTPEWNQVIQTLRQSTTFNDNVHSIHVVQRIQNRALWRAYCFEKTAFLNSKSNSSEVDLLFTNYGGVDTYTSFVSGFGTQSLNFTQNLDKALEFSSNNSSECWILLCRVLPGKVSADLDQLLQNRDRIDSVWSKGQYTVSRESLVYPCYLIRFAP